MLAALGCIWLGWKRYPLWTPLAVFAVVLPLMLFQTFSRSTWRAEAGLPVDWSVELLGFGLIVIVYYFAYGLGIGVRKLLRPTA